MKLIDKIKDLFMDEVVDDDEIEIEEGETTEEYKEPAKNVLPKVMRETIKKEEKVELKVKPQEFIKDEKIENKSVEAQKREFKFPIEFENDVPSRKNRIANEDLNKFDVPREEFLSKKVSNENVHSSNVNALKLEKEASKKVVELYPKKTEEKNVKPKFKASPVISPVYGVLDKNYTKEEVKEKADDTTTLKRPSKKVDFETVRKKAFGNLADDIKDNLLCENCELYKEVKKISALKEGDLLYDMTVEDDEEKEVTIEKAYDNYEEFGVAYEPKVEKKQVVKEEPEENIDTDSIINDTNDDSETNNNVDNFTKIKSKIDDDEFEDNEEVKVLTEVTPVKEEEKKEKSEEIPSRSEKKKDAKVDEDFFELIDSMYKERVDE